MEVTSTKAVEIKDDEHQDENMARELAFYQQALEAARIARDKFRELDVPFSRPDDYYAEMLKSDEHMAKVSFHEQNGVVEYLYFVFAVGATTITGWSGSKQGLRRSEAATKPQEVR